LAYAFWNQAPYQASRSAAFIAEELNMKKTVLALTALAAFTGSAMAADMAPRTYSKAPEPMMAVANWTGFYVFGGAGGGLWAADSNVVTFPGLVPVTRDQRMGGSGWFGTVGAGYDWQFNNTWVAGVFADGTFGSIRGSLTNPVTGLEGRETLRDTWAAGVRLGALVAPNVYSYVNAGYTGSQWSGTSMSTLAAGGGPIVATTGSFTRSGFFFGGGVENSLNIFGINAPGWFMKTEYRGSYFSRITLPETSVATGLLNGDAVTFKPWVQMVSTSLVYRFNSPVVAKY
jgi:outer membrane immunogenic protein